IRGLNEVRAKWDAVYDADPEAQFFSSWVWLSKWLAAINAPLSILAARPDDGPSDYVAFFPLWLKTKELKSGGFYNDLIIGGLYLADYTGVLCRPEFEDQAMPAFARHIKQLNWAHLQLEYLRASDRRMALFMREYAEGEIKVTEHNPVDENKVPLTICPVAALPADWDEYLDTKLSANTRQKIRRLLRQIDRSDEFRISHVEKATLDRDIEILFRFWTSRWGPLKGDRLPGILDNNRMMLRHAFENGALHLPVLWHGDRPVGALATFVDARKKSFLFYMAGRDQAYDGPPPGLALHAHSIRHAIRNGFTTYDFLRGNEAYKYSFGVEEHRIKSYVLATKNEENLGGRLDIRSLPFALKHAKEHHRAGRHDKAEPGFRQILDLEPRNADALYCMGQIMAARAEHAAAIGMFKTLLADSPQIYKAWVRLGKSLAANDQPDEAVEALCEGIGREPAKTDAYHALGHVLLDLGLYDQAIGAFDAVRDLQPDHPDVGASLMKAVRLRGGLSSKELARRAASHADIRGKVAALSAVAAALSRDRQAMIKTPALLVNNGAGVKPLFPLRPEPGSAGFPVQQTPTAHAEDGLRLYNESIARFLPQAKAR
ncbi:MAG TPA: GNAT family N-acetyltransferase, partial [Bradyrhizobium sp.]|nr:GNAT family N-acetyltransferase [Bradyrhizobium sp.]